MVKTIVWDVDDVLNDFIESWFENCFIKEHHDSKLIFNDLIVNPPCDILGISIDQYLMSLDEYRISEEARDLLPNKNAINWFNECGHKYRHVALTSRSRKTVSFLADWVLRYYGDWIRTFAFIPAKRTGQKIPVYDINKAEYLTWFNSVDLFIDDCEDNIKDAKKKGINTLLYPQPWNNSNLTVDQFFKNLSDY